MMSPALHAAANALCDDPYFIPLDKEDPPVYQVYHDNVAAEYQIGPHPGRLVAHHLSDFLKMLVPTRQGADCGSSLGDGA